MKMNTRKSVVVLLFLSCLFFLFACGNSSSGGSSDNGAGATSGASGIFTINTSGADGGPDGGFGGGFGGDGGYVDIQMIDGSMGPLQVMASGAADASFTPTASTPNLGNNPLAITADTTVTVEVAEPVAGTPYLVAASSILRISDGNGTLSDEAAVTGISVAAGTTLTLELNNTPDAQVDLSNDIDNDGTITTVDVNATQRGNLILTLNSYHGNSTIDTSGTLDGQSGGYVQINPSYSFLTTAPLTPPVRTAPQGLRVTADTWKSTLITALRTRAILPLTAGQGQAPVLLAAVQVLSIGKQISACITLAVSVAAAVTVWAVAVMATGFGYMLLPIVILATCITAATWIHQAVMQALVVVAGVALSTCGLMAVILSTAAT